MRFSTKTTYGLRALIYLTNQPAKQSVPLSAIAQAEKISQKYLEIIFASLKKANLVKSSQGAGGGYHLARPAKEISVFEIIKALEKNMNVFHCVDEHGKVYCSQACHCGVTLVLAKVQQAVNQSLRSLKLSELVK